jgi:hypothetical protein
VKLLGFLILSAIAHAANSDQVILAVMQHAGPAMERVGVLERAPVAPDLDLVVALGAPKAFGTATWWGEKTRLGILLQRRAAPETVYSIAVESGRSDGDCYARVERATAMDVVISCTPEKGRPGPLHKFTYDVRAKKLLAHTEWAPFPGYRIFPSNGKAILVASDASRLIAIEYDPGGHGPFRVLGPAEAEPWIRRVPVSAGTVGMGAGQRQEIWVQPEPFRSTRFGPGDRFSVQRDGDAIFVAEGPRGKRYLLPRSTYDQFARARPARVKDGYQRGATQLEEQIGPWQIADGRFWFAKTFYDGEGMSGIGGFGWFDTERRTFELRTPPEVVNSSVTAMSVTPDAVWLALANRGEWATTGHGLLRYDRATERVETFELRDVALAMAPVGDGVLLATEFGAAVVNGGAVTRYFVDRTGDRLRMVEAAP